MTNIKADRVLLIKALEAEQKKETEKFKRDMERFREAEKAYAETLAVALEKAAAQVRKGNIPTESTRQRMNGGEYKSVPVFNNLPPMPDKPTKNGRGCELERMIATLKLSKQDTISINENSVYVKFACAI